MSRIRPIAFLLAAVLLAAHAAAQPTNQLPSGAIRLAMKRLNFLASALYLAAHPDDENTRLIAYLANDRLASTAYLSITRGDGGQNLIGPEIGDPLGVIRTQELLAARRIDQGNQFFTRAVDFGFSKSSQEAFRIWGKEAILSDVVRIIRKFRPDVIITRFPPDARAGHGHHTASAMLAHEAFRLAGDSTAFPDQVKELGVWSPLSLYTNTGVWWNDSISKDTPGVIAVDVGGYSPLLGASYAEVAARSRSQHKSQGFGSAGRRGELLEFLEYVDGYRARRDVFEAVDTTWLRVKGGVAVQPLVDQLLREFDEDDPSKSTPLLLALREKIAALPPSVWRTDKLWLTDRLIVTCLGLYAEASVDRYCAPPGEPIACAMELVNRSVYPVTLRGLSITGLRLDSTCVQPLLPNAPLLFSVRKPIDAALPYSSPYWLREKHALGCFNLTDEALIEMPENPPALSVALRLELGGKPFVLEIPLTYKWTDPIKGELRRPFAIVPALSVSFSQSVLVFDTDEAKSVNVLVKSHSAHRVEGELALHWPPRWRAEPAQAPFQLPQQGSEQRITFKVYPSAGEHTAILAATAQVGDVSYHQTLQEIDYDHIPAQIYLRPAEVRVSRLDLKIKGKRVGYIQGAGDQEPEAIRTMGYSVRELADEEITPSTLSTLDAVALGVRALNTRERIAFIMPALLRYVRDGGTLIVQYNIDRGLKIDADQFAPYPLTLSRDRITDEQSPVKILNPNHPALKFPNVITAADFEGWVQERGLYFPNRWDDRFEPLLALHDPNEPDLKGGLLVCSYGKGYYVYTGLSFFRELPAGVPGAYKLFANLLSLRYFKK